MKQGDFIKVLLPGERPFAEVIRILPDGSWVGRIDNHLVETDPELRAAFFENEFGKAPPCEPLHSYREDELVVFELRDELWQPMTIEGRC